MYYRGENTATDAEVVVKEYLRRLDYNDVDLAVADFMHARVSPEFRTSENRKKLFLQVIALLKEKGIEVVAP